MKKIENYLTNLELSQVFKLLRISIGIIYLWFGVLKFFPHLSPAEDLAINTIQVLTFGLISGKTSILLLAGWECMLGIALLFGNCMRICFYSLIAHMICTFTPMFFFPLLTFKSPPLVFTIEGQYIMKNIIIVSAALLIYVSHLKEEKKLKEQNKKNQFSKPQIQLPSESK